MLSSRFSIENVMESVNEMISMGKKQHQYGQLLWLFNV